MNVLVACEESQRVCKAFRSRGHRAFSCDIQECSGGFPEWHIQGDVTKILNGNCEFTLQNGQTNKQTNKWDLIIAFPPCTHLAVSGAAWFEKKRQDGRQKDAIDFFCMFFDVDCPRVSIENPVGIISGDYISRWFPEIAKKYDLPKKPTQIIQPYMFGHHAKKSTCLWLKGLPPLVPTNIVDEGEYQIAPSGKRFNIGASASAAKDENGKILAWNDPLTAKIRSKTFEGVAEAMAEQWGNYAMNNMNEQQIPGQMSIFDYEGVTE